jgi:hypothetical protein
MDHFCFSVEAKCHSWAKPNDVENVGSAKADKVSTNPGTYKAWLFVKQKFSFKPTVYRLFNVLMPFKKQTASDILTNFYERAYLLH